MTAVDAAVSEGNPLLDAARSGGLEGFEAAWTALISQAPGPAVFIEALNAYELAAERDVAVPLLSLLIDSCRERNEHAQVLDVVQALVPYRPRKIDLMQVARDALAGRFADEPWGDLFVRLSNMEEGADVSDAIDTFAHLCRLLPGKAVYHPTGWGEGVVMSADAADESITVNFRKDGRDRTMPFTTGLDVLRPLADDDLRARLLIDAEGLARDAENEPAVLIRAVARLTKGRCSAKEVKAWLGGTVVTTSSWASWWKKAKIAAAADPWLLIENPARPVFILRGKPLSAEEEVTELLNRARTLGDVLEVVRGPLALDPVEGVKTRLLQGLSDQLACEGGDESERIEGALILARHEHIPVAEAGEVIGKLLDEGGSFGAIMSSLSPAPVRREALEAFAVARPHLWTDPVVADMTTIPPTLLDAVTDRLLEAGRGSAIANRLHIYLLQPSRQPFTVIRLAKRWAAGVLDDVEGAPSLAEVFIGMMHLAETQAPKAEREDKGAKAVMKTLVDLLQHKRYKLFERFGTEATRPEMERAIGVVTRSRTMPDEITIPLQTACHARWPDLVPRDETPFWESSNIYCSNDGLARRHEEYRVLLEEKIPENSESIGKAAAFGDLSENFEWTAAIEQQRQLTEKAAAMEAELKLARAIEDQDLPEGAAAPGTRVTFEQDGKAKTITIMGPWDAGEGVVSYRAPMAEGMLGVAAGDEATLELPGGQVVVKIVTVERAVEASE